jgi:hypothetical protein
MLQRELQKAHKEWELLIGLVKQFPILSDTVTTDEEVHLLFKGLTLGGK